MKILIIGCNGFIGRNAYDYFKAKNYQTYGADINFSENAFFILSSDLSNIHELFQINEYDVCINASGSATVGFSIVNPNQDYILNYLNVVKIVQAITDKQPQCKFLNLSSAAVYGNPAQLPVKEDENTFPISPYGKHKLQSEQLLKKYAIEHHLKTISLRVFSVYGNGLKKQLFWDIYQKSLFAQSITLHGKGNETRDFIHIDDLMLAIEKIILHANFQGESINVASGKEYTIEAASTLLLKFLNPSFAVNFNGVQNQSDPLFWQADISKLISLGFNPKVELNEGLKKYAVWLKELN